MTAPAIAQAPVVATPTTVATPSEQSAPATPIVETPQAESQQEQGGVTSIIERLARRPLPDEVKDALVDGTPAPATAGPTDIVPPPTAAQPAAEAPTNIVQEIIVNDPDGIVELRARAEDGRYQPLDQGQKLEMRIRDPETGETRIYNKTLPEIMRMAKDGVAMQKSREELQYYRTKTPEWQQAWAARDAEIQSKAQETESYKALAIALLTEPEDQVVAKRQAYAAQFTPEAQAQKLARENAELRQRLLTPRQNTPNVAQSSQPDVQPQQIQALSQRIGQTVAAVEQMVGKEKAAGKIALDMAPLYVNGRIPPERFPQLEQYVQGPYRQWAEAEAAKQSTAAQQAEAQLAEARRVQTAAQSAARNTGTATKPGPVAPKVAEPQRPARTLTERMDRIIRKQSPAQLTG